MPSQAVVQQYGSAAQTFVTHGEQEPAIGVVLGVQRAPVHVPAVHDVVPPLPAVPAVPPLPAVPPVPPPPVPAAPHAVPHGPPGEMHASSAPNFVWPAGMFA